MNFDDYVKQLNKALGVGISFDVLSRQIEIGGRRAVYYCIDGFSKDELMQKLLQYFMDKKPEDVPSTVEQFVTTLLPYGEVDTESDLDKILTNILSGVFALFIDGYDKCILIDSRTYPARSVTEPDKDKTLRGSKDGFVETIVFNTALMRRRIRSTDLRIEMKQAGETSRTDIAICYMENRVDHKFLQEVLQRIDNIKVDALTMNQESLAECLFPHKWLDPFPKFKFTERPDVCAAQVLEGNIIIMVDNSPFAMILPVSFFDILEEADDYYFQPITGTYLRLSRTIILIGTFFLTPTFLLLMEYPQWIPEQLAFIMVKETIHIPLLLQLLLLELAVDGLRLAAVNTPNMLSTPFSVLAGMVLGEFSVKSGWFNAECMLYMACVSLATYTQDNYEFGYALKFFRIISLILTAMLGWIGYVGGILFLVISIVCNRMVSGKSYLYPILPFSWKKLKERLIRRRLKR